MALNVMSTLVVNGLTLEFCSDSEAEKLSLSVQFPDWMIEVRGKDPITGKKVQTGWEPKSFSKRAFNSLTDWMDSEIPEKFLISAIDKELPSLRGHLGKANIRSIRHNPVLAMDDMGTELDTNSNMIKDEHGNWTISNVHSFVGLVQQEFETLTPKSGSLADPELEAKKSVAKMLPYAKIVWTSEAIQEHKEKVIAEKLAEVERFKKAFESVSLEALKSYAVEKFTNNGTDDEGFVRLKGQKEA